MLTEIEMQTLRANIEKYEGKVRHMYVNARGCIMVGVGQLLVACDDAQRLPFQYDNGDLANEDDIATEYNTLKAQESHHIASYYRQFTNLTLSDRAIKALLNEHIESLYHELHIIYDNFDEFPSNVKLALFDLISHLGMTSLRKGWLPLNTSLSAGDWVAAANNCSCSDVSDTRNTYVKTLLLNAEVDL